ncbi:MAG: hypothetical protein ACOX8A_01295, partial [Thermacetogeniaceae bacterium]
EKAVCQIIFQHVVKYHWITNSSKNNLWGTGQDFTKIDACKSPLIVIPSYLALFDQAVISCRTYKRLRFYGVFIWHQSVKPQMMQVSFYGTRG